MALFSAPQIKGYENSHNEATTRLRRVESLKDDAQRRVGELESQIKQKESESLDQEAIIQKVGSIRTVSMSVLIHFQSTSKESPESSRRPV